MKSLAFGCSQVLYVFGIAFTQICDGMDIAKSYFPNVLESMLTLLIHGVPLGFHHSTRKAA